MGNEQSKRGVIDMTYYRLYTLVRVANPQNQQGIEPSVNTLHQNQEAPMRVHKGLPRVLGSLRVSVSGYGMSILLGK